MSSLVVRVATADDAPEVLRLAHLMWRSFGMELDDEGDEPWRSAFHVAFRSGIDEGRMRAYVVDRPLGGARADGAAEGSSDAATVHGQGPVGLVSCGVAWVYDLLPAPWLVNGRMGYLQWFSTQPEWQGRGLATAVLEECRAWLEAQGCTRIHLHASPSAVPLYRQHDFEDTYFPNLWYSTPGTSVH